MLITQGTARSEATDRRLACILAAIAGALNASAFQAVGFFAANMTGNVSALSDRMALGQWLIGGFYLSIVLTFVFGAAVSTLLVNGGRRRNIRSIYALTVLAEGLLMGLLGVLVQGLPITLRAPFLILGLAFLMGLQNAIVTTISGARVRTTHVSGMATDIGIELMMLLDMARGVEPSAERNSYRSKLRLHVQTVLAFLAGGMCGVLLYQSIGNRLLFVTASLLLLMAANGIYRAQKMA
ncbi:MAG: YoaK family protein [Rhodanobacter sp.]